MDKRKPDVAAWAWISTGLFFLAIGHAGLVTSWEGEWSYSEPEYAVLSCLAIVWGAGSIAGGVNRLVGRRD